MMFFNFQKRYRKELEKEFNPLATRDKDGTYIYLGMRKRF